MHTISGQDEALMRRRGCQVLSIDRTHRGTANNVKKRTRATRKRGLVPCLRCGLPVQLDGTCNSCGKGALRYGPCGRCRAKNVLVNHLDGVDTCGDCWDDPPPPRDFVGERLYPEKPKKAPGLPGRKPKTAEAT